MEGRGREKKGGERRRGERRGEEKRGKISNYYFKISGENPKVAVINTCVWLEFIVLVFVCMREWVCVC